MEEVVTVHGLKPYEFWDKIGRPKKIVAPMVDHSDLAYRMMTRKYGADLVYTQMLNANSFVMSKEFSENNFTTCPEDRPLIAQFAGHDPDVLLAAAQRVEDVCDAVDINLGCPQGIAKRGRYGAFLMEELDLLDAMVRKLATNLKIPVTCKTRIYKDFDRSIRLCETLVNAGASMLTIHGRTREEKGQLVRDCDWDMIRRIKEHFAKRAIPVPVVANGGIECLDDVYRCIEVTGCDGVMSSEAILENPALYTRSLNSMGIKQSQLELTEEYLRYAEQYPVWHMKCIRSHVMKMLYRYINVHVELRDMCGLSHTIEQFFGVCRRCRELVTNQLLMRNEELSPEEATEDSEYNVSWYRRYARITEYEGGNDPATGKPFEIPYSARNKKDALLDLKSSWIRSTYDDTDSENLWGGAGGESEGAGCSIFSSMFNTGAEE